MRRLLHRAVLIAAALAVAIGMAMPAAPSCAMPAKDAPMECPCCDAMLAGMSCPQTCQPAVVARVEPMRSPSDRPAWLDASIARLRGLVPAPLDPPPR